VHAHREEPAERLAEESADLLYHLLVLLRDYGVDLGEVEEVLNGRRR
jgi:phosphoribosyl-ATP pyrophosphohydrolase/phosphoribosyl-AMP cyclohydrolase